MFFRVFHFVHVIPNVSQLPKHHQFAQLHRAAPHRRHSRCSTALGEVCSEATAEEAQGVVVRCCEVLSQRLASKFPIFNANKTSKSTCYLTRDAFKTSIIVTALNFKSDATQWERFLEANAA